MAIVLYLLIITLNVNLLSYSMKNYTVAEWIKKQYPSICCQPETHFSFKNTNWFQWKY